MIRTIEAALEPHRDRKFTLPGVGYGALGGFPSGKLPELGYATWRWFKLDNAKANLADDVRHALAEFIGCFFDAGPTYTPDDRPYIERFFGSIAANLSSRLPGYTGSNARDVRRALADPKGNLRLYVSLDELEELLEAALANYNAMPHDGLNGRTPLEAVDHSVRRHGAMLNWLPEAKRRTLCLMQTPKRATVRGYLHQGQRPHINFYGVRYTNSVLASTAVFLGQELRLYYNSQDLRTVRAFAGGGVEIGVLKAQGAWGEIAHDLKLRQEIIRQRGRKRLAGALSQEFLQAFIEQKLAKAKRTRRAASELTQTLRTLAAAPTSVSAMHSPKSDAQPSGAEAPPSPVYVEPERLTIADTLVGTPAIQAFADLITRCLRYRITGALTYGPSRIGKTRAIEYLRLLLAETHPKVTTYHAQAEHKPRHAEGPFFANLLEAVGYPEPDSGGNPTKRMRLINKIKEACARNGSGTVVLFCDEAQRYDENEYEWLRDVHDHLDRLQIRLFTFLVGQQELLAVKTAMQRAKKTQIVARLMVEELAFFGIRNVRDVATCLAGYDQTNFPRASDWSFTRFYLPQAVAAGYTLVADAGLLWAAFEKLHHKYGLPGELEIPMESFARAVEIVLKESELRDEPAFRPDTVLWSAAVRSCGYIQSRQATSQELAQTAA